MEVDNSNVKKQCGAVARNVAICSVINLTWKMVILLGLIKYLPPVCWLEGPYFSFLCQQSSVTTSDPEARVSGGWRGDLEILSQEGGEKEGGELTKKHK